jgi:uncharacterized membrane protein
MYVQRALLVMILLALLFLPTLDKWMTSDALSWYKPYLLWGAVIFFIYLSQRKSRHDEF